MIVYGIPNCDTIKKTRRWLEEQGIDYRFHDFRKDGLCPRQLMEWVMELGWEPLLNRRGLTWRKLPEEVKSDLDRDRAIELMTEFPALIKRPVLDTGTRRVVGFDPARYTSLLIK